MAVEAQLCPQCGATVQFSEMQTEVVCSYCGTTVDKTLVQAIQRVNNVGELSRENQAKVNKLILDGRRKDALFFIQQYTGLGEASSNAFIDQTITEWAAAHGQTPPATDREAQIVTGIKVINRVGIGALAVWELVAIIRFVVLLATNPNAGKQIGDTLGLLVILPCGLFFFAIVFWNLYTSRQFIDPTMRGRQVRLSMRRSQTRAAVVQKVVALMPARAVAGALITTRLQMEVPTIGQLPKVLEVALDLPPATANSLNPGAKIEVITNGLDFFYVTDPIKVVS